ncbi:hypothetical protein J19TS1_43860 [Heyndrickxia oleronia]|nr:hypothetical protein J19TS1_43860 [Heyndrickxia oleronia]
MKNDRRLTACIKILLTKNLEKRDFDEKLRKVRVFINIMLHHRKRNMGSNNYANRKQGRIF